MTGEKTVSYFNVDKEGLNSKTSETSVPTILLYRQNVILKMEHCHKTELKAQPIRPNKLIFWQHRTLHQRDDNLEDKCKIAFYWKVNVKPLRSYSEN